MPQLIFRGISEQTIAAASREMVDDLTRIVGCPRDYFTLEYCPTVFIGDGNVVAGASLVQVNWFERGQDVRDQVARCVTKHLQMQGCAAVDVYFIALQEACYYENGEHF